MIALDCISCGATVYEDQDVCGNCGLSVPITIERFRRAAPPPPPPPPIPLPPTKWCSKCREEKYLHEYARDGRWHRSECKECQAFDRKRGICDATRAMRAARNRAYYARCRAMLERARRGQP